MVPGVSSSDRRRPRPSRQYACRCYGGPFGIGREAHDMTSLAEADSKFGDVVRGAGGAIFGIEKSPSIGSRQNEKLQIGTADGFVKIAVRLEQPYIDEALP